MKQVSLVFCFISFVLLGISNAYPSGNEGYVQGQAPAVSQPIAPAAHVYSTANTGYQNTPVNKLGRGVSNILTFYLEIPASMLQTCKCHGDSFASLLTGTLKGVVTALYRGLTGVCDTITFFAPPYDKPIMQPEYAEQSLSQEADKD
jgi:putative exosortase-associated protein (TIGR04073 family)